MPIHGLHHVVLRIPNLAEAEAFYRELFDLDVLFREGTYEGTFGKVPDDLDWEDATARGVEPGMSFLGRDEFALALFEPEGEKDAEEGQPSRGSAARHSAELRSALLDHIALALDPDDRDAVRDRAADLDCEYEEKSDAVFVTDRYGVEWELNASSPPPQTPFDELDV
ncbi:MULTISPECIES: VOC family protein [Halorussus]|uniref:VOC family protein n=1 Tax=Halorussus TaxID=1070314 RepID=UPI0020A09FE4|nr:VOC family protein [Halorussus vallis]USZ77629.1 VOC family protein [Halorussus vallis]